jgi:hypothetical protein
MYFSAFLLGIGNSLIMVTSVSLEADLVGEDFESGAFVYGCMSFTDKLINGIAVRSTCCVSVHYPHGLTCGLFVIGCAGSCGPTAARGCRQRFCTGPEDHPVS